MPKKKKKVGDPKTPEWVRGALLILARGKALELFSGMYKLSRIFSSKGCYGGRTAQCAGLVFVVDENPELVFTDEEGVSRYASFWRNCSRSVGAGSEEELHEAPPLCRQHRRHWDRDLRMLDGWIEYGKDLPAVLTADVSQSFDSAEEERESWDTYRQMFGFTEEEVSDE